MYFLNIAEVVDVFWVMINVCRCEQHSVRFVVTKGFRTKGSTEKNGARDNRSQYLLLNCLIQFPASFTGYIVASVSIIMRLFNILKIILRLLIFDDFVDNVFRSVFNFKENSSNVFPKYSNGKQLNTAEKDDSRK